jgi:ribosomal-protein-alanine N-acetyltransferase
MSEHLFESERLRFRPQRLEDATALHEAYGDVDLMRYWSRGPIATVAETIEYLRPHVDHPDWRGWSIIRKGGEDVIGTLAASERRSGVVEIGYMLVRSAWGQGYAREAVTRLLDRLFHDEGRRRVFADTDPENDASNRLLEDLGFTREGLLRAEWETHIGLRDSVIWGLLKDEWISSSASIRA